MKAFLLYRDRDFELGRALPPQKAALTQDLELNTLFNAMARGDEFLFQVAKQALLSGLGNDPDTILYRQAILKDCLKNPPLVREIYALAVEAIEREKKNYWGFFRDQPDTVLQRSLQVLQMFVEMLRKLRRIADASAAQFESEGFTAFFVMLQRELTDEYLAIVQEHLRELKFHGGVLSSAELGKGNKGTNYVLRKENKKMSWLERLLDSGPPVYTFYIADRDENGASALRELQNRGINLAANALGQSADHILSFFKMLRTELALYVGCLNLHERLAQKGEPLCFPVPLGLSERKLAARGLYDVSLTLNMEQRVVGNDLNADHKNLVIITGANQGGKSTFLRSVGLAQLMMQCGMFAPAESFSANLCDNLFTHSKREEDPTMQRGKLDEELSRLSQIVDHITPNSLLLCNESFAATNEREGSEIARQIVCALAARGIKVFFVTHLYEFAHALARQKMANALFLRAERQPDGTRTFKLIEGKPLETSYGKDLYERIFGADDQIHSDEPVLQTVEGGK